MANNTISQVEINGTTYDLLDANTLSAVSSLREDVTALQNSVASPRMRVTASSLDEALTLMGREIISSTIADGMFLVLALWSGRDNYMLVGSKWGTFATFLAYNAEQMRLCNISPTAASIRTIASS